jgi:hypothetical protein
MTDAEKLALWCEAASGACREIDGAIKNIVGHGWDYSADWDYWNPFKREKESRPVAHPYTASIDAAMTLVPEGGRWWKAGDNATGGSRMVVVDTGEDGRWTVFGECPCPETVERNALALCAAALRARAQTLTGDHAR